MTDKVSGDKADFKRFFILLNNHVNTDTEAKYIVEFDNLCERLESALQQPAAPDLSDVKEWADGIASAIGTEHAPRVTFEEMKIADMVINHTAYYRNPAAENVAEDTYWTIADMLEPHIERINGHTMEQIKPGFLPASVHDSVEILLHHRLATGPLLCFCCSAPVNPLSTDLIECHKCEKAWPSASYAKLASLHKDAMAASEPEQPTIRQQLLPYVPPISEWPERANWFAFNRSCIGWFFKSQPQPNNEFSEFLPANGEAQFLYDQELPKCFCDDWDKTLWSKAEVMAARGGV